MAKPRLPSADTFMAMLDRIPDDVELASKAYVDTKIKTDASHNITAISPKLNPHVVEPISPSFINENSTANLAQTATHTIGQPVNQTVIQTVAGSDGYLDSLSDGFSTRQSDVQTDFHTDSHTFRQSIGQLFRQSDDQTVSQTAIQTVKHPVVDTMLFSDPIRGLTRSQCLVLLFLIQQPGITQRPAISEHTGVPFGTVKDALSLLFKKGFISKPHYYVNGDYRGISYVINRSLCDDFLRKRGPDFNQTVSQTINKTVSQTVSQTVIISDGHSDSQTVAFSSKVFKEDLNLTTTGSGIFEDPELKFWKGEGVTEKQVQNWMTEFQLSHDEIVMSLRYGRFDILERGDVNNSANWFYKILTRNGFYPKPANYRSLSEIKAEALLQQQERDREAKAKIEAVEFEAKFQAFLEDSDSPLFKELFDKIGSFAKDQFKDGERMAAEIALKDLFKIYLKTA